MALPAELLDHILSFLQSEPKVLKKCSESHPLLRQLAEPYLSSYIWVRTDNTSFQGLDLTELLSKRPYIVHYIRHLEIYVSDGDDKETRRCCLEELSTILPNLLALREITLDHTLCAVFGWEEQPESFRRAFLDCLRSQSMQDVHLKHIWRFPFTSALNGECSIRSLTVRGGTWQHSKPSPINNLDLDGPFMNQGPPLKSLRIQLGRESFLHGFVPWFATCRSQLRSLEFFSLDDRGYDLLPKLLTSSSNSLTSLDLNLGFARRRYYDFDLQSFVHGATDNIPVTLSALPHLEQLTISAALHYLAIEGWWGFCSPISAITQLFSTNTLSLKRLILNFNFTIGSRHLVQTKSLPLFLLSEVICTPLVHLLSVISAFSSASAVFIQVDLRLGTDLTSHIPALGPQPRAIPQHILHSLLSDSKELMQFVEQGRLTIPSVPTAFDVNDSDYW